MKYSITIPAYKAKFLHECIESILAQTYTDFELIIVNDASPEDLDTIVDKFQDSRIRYYKNEKNCGAIDVVDNWNICLSYAKGDYIICMGDDDKLSPYCLEEYNLLMDKYPDLDIYHTRVKIINEHSELVDYQEPRPEYESVYAMIYYRLRGRVQFIGDFLFKTSTLRKNNGFYKLPLAWGSDEISSYIAAKEKGIANTCNPTFFYRVNSMTLSNSGNYFAKIEAMREEIKWFNQFLSSECPKEEMDNFFYKKISKEMPLYLKKLIFDSITMDIKSSPVKQFKYWLLNRKKEDLTIYQLARLANRVLFKRKRYI
ncbi:MAG: glycosyltransferase family 2 protein [Phocaeicola sp.]